MIIGVKYYDRDAAVPGTWTDVEVAVIEYDFEERTYDEYTALDGTEDNYSRTYYYVRLIFDPVAFNDATYGPVITSLRTAERIRIYDQSGRYTDLGSSNTITFRRVGSNRPQRSAASDLTKTLELNLSTVEVQ